MHVEGFGGINHLIGNFRLDVIFIPINGSYLETGVSTARTQQAGPSRGQAAWDYL